jgi:hypothetical protein
MPVCAVDDSSYQVISCSYFSQSALRKGCPNRNPF